MAAINTTIDYMLTSSDILFVSTEDLITLITSHVRYNNAYRESMKSIFMDRIKLNTSTDIKRLLSEKREAILAKIVEECLPEKLESFLEIKMNLDELEKKALALF